MKQIIRRIVLAGCTLLSSATIAASNVPVPGDTGVPRLRILPAEHVDAATHVRILGATRAAGRIVAVGDHGVVLLSDDSGRAFRQAHSVPVRSTLTAVAFTDADTGWAVGHWGVIIKTTDGGENWTLQRNDMNVDQPLFSVYFRSATEGWAAGLWSLLLHTTDGGESWSAVTVSAPGAKKEDRNFYSIFADRQHDLFIACEQGRVARSRDDGKSWTVVDTGYAGSFWTGIALGDDALLVAGLRGTIYRSTDGGDTWRPSKVPYRSSMTGMSESPDRHVVAVGLDGVLLVSNDDGVSFSGTQRADRTALTSLVDTADGGTALFSVRGPVGR